MDSKEYKKLASNKDEDESFLDYGTLSDEEKRQKGSNDSLLERATYTSSDLLFQIGFGKSQVLLLTLLSFAYMAQYNMVTMMPYLSTRLYVDMDLSPSLESSLGVASYAGFAVSYPFWGLVADKFGRRWSLLLASFWILFWNALCVLSPSISWVVAFRLMYSLAGGAVNLLLPYAYELLPINLQWIGFFVILSVSQVIGGIYTNLSAFTLFTGNHQMESSWRLYLVAIIIPLLMFIILAIFLLDESPRFLMSKNKPEEAIQILRKMAMRNNVNLPKNLTLVQEKELASHNCEKETFLEKCRTIIDSWHILSSLLCIVAIGISLRFINYGLPYLRTELIFMSGQTNASYCSATHAKTYELQREDYIEMLCFQLLSDLAGPVGGLILMKTQVSLKWIALPSFSVILCTLAFLYTCPEVWVALAIISLIQSLSWVTHAKMWLDLAGVLPTNVRSSMFGFCTFLMYLPMPVTPYLIQVLSKTSHHFVTTVCIAFVSCGLLGSILMPAEIYAN